MFLIAKLFVVVGLIRYLIMTDEWVHCGVAYSIFVLVTGGLGYLAGIVTLWQILIGVTIQTALSFLWFWLLYYVNGVLWWVILLCGVALIF